MRPAQMAGAGPAPRRDPAGALGELLTALDRERRTQSRALNVNERNRVGLLVLHAVVALVVPPLFIFSDFAGPTWSVIKTVPGFPYTWVLPLWIGGLILMPATFARHKNWEMVGLILIYIWYAAMGLGFAAPAVAWGVDAWQAWRDGRPPPGGKPSLYAPAIYFHLAMIMRIHFATLWRFRRGDREESQRAMLLGAPR